MHYKCGGQRGGRSSFVKRALRGAAVLALLAGVAASAKHFARDPGCSDGVPWFEWLAPAPEARACTLCPCECGCGDGTACPAKSCDCGGGLSCVGHCAKTCSLAAPSPYKPCGGKQTCKSAAGCASNCPLDASTPSCDTCSNYTGADKCVKQTCAGGTPSAVGCAQGCPGGGENAYQGGGAACETCSNYTGSQKKCTVKTCPVSTVCEGGDAHYSNCSGSTAGTYHCDKYCCNDTSEPSCVKTNNWGTYCCGGCGREGYTYTGCPAASPGEWGCETESTSPPGHCRDGLRSCAAVSGLCGCSGDNAPCSSNPGTGNCMTCGHHVTECTNNNGECKGSGGYNDNCVCSGWWCNQVYPRENCGVPGDCHRAECHS